MVGLLLFLHWEQSPGLAAEGTLDADLLPWGRLLEPAFDQAEEAVVHPGQLPELFQGDPAGMPQPPERVDVEPAGIGAGHAGGLWGPVVASSSNYHGREYTRPRPRASTYF